MKSFILIAVLAALTVGNYAASIPDDASLYEEGAPVYQVGSIDRLGEVTFYDRMVYLDPWPGAVKIQDIEYIGKPRNVITGIRIFNPPANSTLGPLGSNKTFVKLITAPGGWISSRVQIFGRFK